MWKNSTLGALLGCLVGACTTPGLPTGGAVADRSDLDTLLAVGPSLHPCSATEISTRLGIQLEVRKQTRHWTFYGARGHGAILEYDLRVPKASAVAASEGRPAPMLIANLMEGAVSYETMSAQLGPPVPGSFDVQPAGGPTAYYESFDPRRNMILVGAGQDDPPAATEVIVNCR